MVHFVGAGPGAEDLITVRGMNLIGAADVIIYAGSLVNPGLLNYKKEGAIVYDSALMTLDEVIEVMKNSDEADRDVVRLHTGEPSIYGAVREQMDRLDSLGIAYDSCPGVSACFGAASSLNIEYTLSGKSQTLIITRMEGKTSVPEKEQIEELAKHEASMAIYLSSGMLDELTKRLIAGGYDENTPAAIVYKATWSDEKRLVGRLKDIPKMGRENGISRLAVVLVGSAVSQKDYELSRLYAKDYSTGYRKAKV